MASKKASGFVREDQRHTKRLTLRLDPLVADLLEHVSQSLDADKNALISLAVLKAFGHQFVEGPAALAKLEDEINTGQHPTPPGGNDAS